VSKNRFDRGSATTLALTGKVMVASDRRDVTPDTGAPVDASAENNWTKIDAVLGPPTLVEIARVSCVREYRPGPHVVSLSPILKAMP
jgi:hypothetical protein